MRIIRIVYTIVLDGAIDIMVLIDRYGRPMTHARISVTLRCNHDCIFCHREGINYNTTNELSAEDWGFVAKVGVSIGIKYYKLTGGEPLVRPDIHLIAKYMVDSGGEVSIVTNGSLLKYHAKKLVEAGISHINVSLHSLKEDTFKLITRGKLESVLAGIEEALKYNIPLKIDYVVLSYNADEYKNIIDYAEKHGIDINIIELIPLGMDLKDYEKLHKPIDYIIEFLEKYSTRKYVKEFQSRPVYILPSGIRVTVIKGFCNPEMCMKCTRIRFTPDGKIKTCLFRNDTLVNAREYIINRNVNGLINALKKANDLREPFFKFKK